MISIELPDGTVKEYPQPVSADQVATDISPRLASAAACAEVDGVRVDMATLLPEGRGRQEPVSEAVGREVDSAAGNHSSRADSTAASRVAHRCQPSMRAPVLRAFRRSKKFRQST